MANPSVFNISAGDDFLGVLVKGLKARLGADDLPRALILLPTRRACQHLREAFLKDAAGEADTALLLPDIRSLGDVEEEELSLSAGHEFMREVMQIPRAIDPMKRRMLLTKLVVGMNLPGHSRAQGFLLAGDLARLIDDALIEGCDLNNLSGLVPSNYAEHWQKIIAFLAIVNQHWPQMLADEDAIDAVDRRQRLTQLLIKHWQMKAPDYPVIAAGSTGSQPQTAAFLKCISRLPKGSVVLPGLDQHMSEEAWQKLDPTHPHFYMARLLKMLEVERPNVKPWADTAVSPRAVLLSEVMQPSEVTDQWRHLLVDKIDEAAWRGLEVIEARQEFEESFMAALMLRKAAEDKATAALITPDRATARRVAGLMRRWGIAVDDSAGQPLLENPLGSYLNLLLDLPRSDVQPSQLMAFFKHPFAGVGLQRKPLLDQARKLEVDFFRRKPRGQGLATWITLLKRDPKFEPDVRLLQTLRAPLQDLESPGEKPFGFWLGAFRSAAESLAIEKDILWRERAGEVLAELFESFAKAEPEFPCLFDDFAGMFRAAMQSAVVRRPWGQHPRLFILGLLEARLLSFDHMICAGLNEGAWPEIQEADPWMSRAMRMDLGCADPESRIGQMAHDFVQAAAHKRVSLLRSARAGEAPTIPSRWLRRLEAVQALLGGVIANAPWAAWAAGADFSTRFDPCARPAVKVPLAAMPKKLSPSAIELWMRDPYAFYAQEVLGLDALEPLDARFTTRERGTLIHRALESLAKRYKTAWPEAAMDDFIAHIRNGLVEYGCSAGEVKLLSARIEGLARAYWVFENTRRKDISSSESEVKDSMAMKVGDYAFTLTARADRMDALKTGGVAILDYKTSSLPPAKQLKALLRPQLFIEAVIADSAAFKNGPQGKTRQIGYVQLDQNQADVDLKLLDLAEDDVESLHLPGLTNFIAVFLTAEARFVAAPRPQWLDPASDYARLARVAEWSRGAIEQEDGGS